MNIKVLKTSAGKTKICMLEICKHFLLLARTGNYSSEQKYCACARPLPWDLYKHVYLYNRLYILGSLVQWVQIYTFIMINTLHFIRELNNYSVYSQHTIDFIHAIQCTYTGRKFIQTKSKFCFVQDASYLILHTLSISLNVFCYVLLSFCLWILQVSINSHTQQFPCCFVCFPRKLIEDTQRVTGFFARRCPLIWPFDQSNTSLHHGGSADRVITVFWILFKYGAFCRGLKSLSSFLLQFRSVSMCTLGPETPNKTLPVESVSFSFLTMF